MTDTSAKEEFQEYLQDLTGGFPEGTVNRDFCPDVAEAEEDGSACVLRYHITPEYSNPQQTAVHGGLTFLILQTSMAYFSGFLTGGTAGPLQAELSYIRPVPVDRPLLVRVTAVRQGRTAGYLRAEAYNEDEPQKTLITASGVFRAEHP